MPTITVNGQQREATQDTRLAQAVEDMGVPIGHRCGGKARCTTCRVEFVSGEPETTTEAEAAKLGFDRGERPGYRLSCQILCTHDMEVKPLMTLESEGWSDTGPKLAQTVEPVAEWVKLSELTR